MEKNLDITTPRYSKNILPQPFVLGTVLISTPRSALWKNVAKKAIHFFVWSLLVRISSGYSPGLAPWYFFKTLFERLRPAVEAALCMMWGLDKLRASEPCESREASVKKKETQVKTVNLQMRSWTLIIPIRVKHSLYWLGLSFRFTD